jgi:hypothetical protein
MPLNDDNSNSEDADANRGTVSKSLAASVRDAIMATAAVEEDDQDEEELHRMSTALDSLGWKKIFVDMRKEVPRITIPKTSILPKKLLLSRGLGAGTDTTNESTTVSNGDVVAEDSPEDDKDENESGESEHVEPIHRLKERGIVSSKDVAAAVQLPDNEIAFHWPMGHNMMVAFSRSRLSTYINKAGRPVVDALAAEILQEIFSFSSTSTNNNDNNNTKEQ